MISMADDMVLDMCELDGDVKVRLQVGRFERVPEARHAPGFVVAIIRTFPDEPASIDEATVFGPSDVFNVPLCMSQDLRTKLVRVLLEACFAVVAYATYLFFNPAAELHFQILITIARVADGYALAMGELVSVSFKSLEELHAMLPPFGAEGESGYEDARASLIAQIERLLR